MIAPSPSLDVLRNGWVDAATTLAPDHPALAELVDQRLDEAASAGLLSEDDLLATVRELEGAAFTAGVPSIAALGMRLRRTVYEYLLALDATSAVEAQPLAFGGGTSAAPFQVADDEPQETGAPEPTADTLTAPEPTSESTALAIEAPSPGDAGADVPGEATETESWGAAGAGSSDEPDAAPAGDGTMEPAMEAAAAVASEAESIVEPQAEALVGLEPEPEVTAWPEASPEPDATAEPEAEFAAESASTFVAPRDGFHITDAHVFAEVERAELPDDDDEAGANRGWRVRENTADARRDAAARGDAPRNVADQPDDPFDTDTRLFDERRRIEERLRKKKCDEAAAMLQSLAQETGGRGVAELAMDAGDRCRGLGKTNAALNCYLAASRADPIYEQPLHRLADICIDDQDIDLAVSYLERIARLHQLRGDNAGALRVYRRVVTVAPYREDILAMLMNARTTGHLPS